MNIIKTFRPYLNLRLLVFLGNNNLHIYGVREVSAAGQGHWQSGIHRGEEDALNCLTSDSRTLLQQRLSKRRLCRHSGPVAELCRSFNRILCAKGE